MRSLFFKIFTSFILIMVLAITSTVFISHWVQIGPFAELQKRAEHSLSAQGAALRPPRLPVLIMVGIAAIGCFFLARSLTAPIRKLRQATRKIATGDFSARVDNIGAGGDEIADLSRDFNVMVKQTEVLLESQKRLLRDISHELRSPLTRQNVALELALQKFPEAESYLQRIAKESARLDELIDHLLVLTRLEGGGAGVVQEEISVRQVLLSIVQDAAFEASSLNRTINLQNGDDVVVVGSAEMLGRAFENVIRNGVRYTPENSVVDVSLIQKGNEVVVTVRDHGPGVSEEYLEHIFTPFYRVATSRTRDSGGVGVGLAIAKQAVLLHGGRIVARNAADGGLVVEIAVPLATA